MRKYGNHLGLLDATWKTTKYAIPLFFLVVKTNCIYQIVASFVIQDETGERICEALKLVKMWNPDWEPAVMIVDNSNQEINALRELFPKTIILLCEFHRKQSWLRWVSKVKNGVASSKDEVLEMLEAVADSLDVKSLKNNLNSLVTSDLWKNCRKLQQWFCRHWLPKYEMWVSAFRLNLLEVVVNTTNGVERMNLEFKRQLTDNHDKSLSSMATVLVTKFCRKRYDRYVEENIKPLEKYVKYSEGKLPRWCWSRPRNFQDYIDKQYKTVMNESISPSHFSVVCQGPLKKWEYVNGDSKYLVSIGLNEDFPHCDCVSWRRHMWPCKHMCALLLHGMTSWGEWSVDYISSPFFNLDSEVLEGNHVVETFNYRDNYLLSQPPPTDSNLNSAGNMVDILPDDFDKSMLPSSSNSSLHSTATKCRDLLHQLRGHTFLVDNEDVLKNLEEKLGEMLECLDKYVPKNDDGLALEKDDKVKTKVVKVSKNKMHDRREIYKNDIPKPPKQINKTLSKRVGRGKERKAKFTEVKVMSTPENKGSKSRTVEEEIAPFDGSPMWYDSNAVRIIPSPKKPLLAQGDELHERTKVSPSSIPLVDSDQVRIGNTDRPNQDISGEEVKFDDHVSEEEEDLLFANQNFSHSDLKEKPEDKQKLFAEDIFSRTIDGTEQKIPIKCEKSKGQNVAANCECQITNTVSAHGLVSERRKNLVFTEGEKIKIRGMERLSDESINLAQYILADSFPAYDGFQDTHQTKIGGWRKLLPHSKYVQILHSAEKDHWVCLASGIDGSHVLYDSLRSASAISPEQKT